MKAIKITNAITLIASLVSGFCGASSFSIVRITLSKLAYKETK
jgi:hypothetical protein